MQAYWVTQNEQTPSTDTEKSIASIPAFVDTFVEYASTRISSVSILSQSSEIQMPLLSTPECKWIEILLLPAHWPTHLYQPQNCDNSESWLIQVLIWEAVTGEA